MAATRPIPGSSRSAPSDSTPSGSATVDQFDAAYRELQTLVEQLEAGGLGLDASLALYERGLALAGTCEEIIRLAELRVTRVSEHGVQDAPGPTETEESDEVAF